MEAAAGEAAARVLAEEELACQRALRVRVGVRVRVRIRVRVGVGVRVRVRL